MPLRIDFIVRLPALSVKRPNCITENLNETESLHHRGNLNQIGSQKEALKMRLTMKEKQSVIAVMQERYWKAGKKLKRQIFDECCRLTGYNRAYASHLLCHYKPALKRKEKAQSSSSGKKTATPYYDGKVKQALVSIWMIMDCICGKRLQPILSEIIRISE
jgi:hypothetical protein